MAHRRKRGDKKNGKTMDVKKAVEVKKHIEAQGAKNPHRGGKHGKMRKQARKPQSAEELDDLLLEYMGVTVKKDQLEEQLDSYFSTKDETPSA